MYRHFLAAARHIVILSAVLVFSPGFASDWEEGPEPSSETSINSKAKANPGSAGEDSNTASDAKSSVSGTNFTGSNPSFFLQGRIEHSDKLAPLSENLQAGSRFDSHSLPAAKYGSNWFKIPSWFAGTFQSTQSVIDYVKDYATGRSGRPNKVVGSLAQEMHGFQKDADGDIWHFYVQSGSSRSEQSGQLTINNIDWYGPELVSKDRVVMRVQATSFVVDKSSGVIVDSFRREDIKTYSPGKNGELNVSYTSKSFDSRGRARDLQDGHSVYIMLAKFQPVDKDASYDYKRMFSDFLSSQKK